MAKKDGEYKYNPEERAKRKANRADRVSSPEYTEPKKDFRDPFRPERSPAAVAPPKPQSETPASVMSALRPEYPSLRPATGPFAKNPRMSSFGMSPLIRENYSGVSGASEGMSPVTGFLDTED